jgi:hypothetical protein
MNVIAKDVTAAGFDPIAWKEELFALNPWARGLTIEEDNAEFAAARQKATLARHAEGAEAWNGWANRMLALKAALEAEGQWAMKRRLYWLELEERLYPDPLLTGKMQRPDYGLHWRPQCSARRF